MRELQLRVEQELKDEFDALRDQFRGEPITEETIYKIKLSIYNLIMKWYSEGRLDPMTNLDGLRDMQRFEVVVARLGMAKFGQLNVTLYEKDIREGEDDAIRDRYGRGHR